MELFVQYETRCVHSYREEREYGDWEEDYDFEVKSVSATSRGQWSGLAHTEERFNVAFDAEVGDTVYVLYMIYSSGDSFGRGTGYNEIIWVFNDGGVAQRALAEVRTKEEQYSLEFRDEVSNTIEFSNPGSGYFEYVQGVYLEAYKIGRAHV